MSRKSRSKHQAVNALCNAHGTGISGTKCYAFGDIKTVSVKSKILNAAKHRGFWKIQVIRLSNKIGYYTSTFIKIPYDKNSLCFPRAMDIREQYFCNY